MRRPVIATAIATALALAVGLGAWAAWPPEPAEPVPLPSDIEGPPIVLVADPLKEIVEIIEAAEHATATAVIDHAMALVNENTVHKVGPWRDRYWYNAEVVFSGVLQSFRGDPRQKPYMSCGPRSVAMGRILQALGIKSRQIGLFTDDTGALLGHNLIEVLNPETGRWEAYDPTWNVHFFDPQTQRRASVLDVMYDDAVVPQAADGRTGWEVAFSVDSKVATPPALLRNDHYFSVVQFYSFSLGRPPIFLVNSNEFDLASRLVDDRPFREWADEVYKRPEWIIADERPIGATLARLEDASDLPVY